MTVAGIDLAVKKPTAIAVLDECQLLYLGLADTDEEIVYTTSLFKPSVVAIDAPLTLPEEGKWVRDVEVELRSLGYRLLPPLLGPMKSLTERGIRISRMFSAEVIEIHPATSLKAMGLTREDLRRKFGVRHRDLIDAIAAALTATAYKLGHYKRYGPFVLPNARVCI